MPAAPLCAQVVAVNSLGDGPTPSEMTSTALAAYMPDAPTSLTATGDRAKATLTFTAPSGAVWYEARALAPTGDSWAVTTASALAPFAPCPLSQPVAGCAALTTPGTGQRQFNVPLAALANLDGRYKFQVRAVDANGVPGEWSAESGIVTVGEWSWAVAFASSNILLAQTESSGGGVVVRGTAAVHCTP